MNTELNHDITEQWESGKLGTNRATVRVAGPEIEEMFDRTTAMKLVTIRLPIPLIDALKVIAEYHGVGYQPMVRDLLTRFALSEFQTIQDAQQRKLAAVQEAETTQPVSNFMEREKRAACA